MSVSDNSNITALLKAYYIDGVENLMFRNSPLLAKIEKVRVEGKSQNFNAMYGRGGAVGGDFTKALAAAASVSKDVEFVVTPGQVFSVYTMNGKEVQASATMRGAYMEIAGAKMFAASEAFRKTIAAALYGTGFGEIASLAAATSFVANTAIDITLPDSAIMAIDVGSIIAEKASISASTVNTFLTVNTINGNTVNVTPSATYSGLQNDALCLDGSINGANPLLPVGLGGWLPTIGARTGTAWTNYIATTFFGVNRSIAPDRLAGAFYQAATTAEKYSTSIQSLMRKCRRAGSKCDLIVMNDADFLTFSAEIQATNTYFTATSTKTKREANVGFDKLSASFSTNYIENIYDDPYCPQGRFYVLDSQYIKLWGYTNTTKLDNGVVNNDPGKQEPLVMNGEGHAKSPLGLIIDDYLNIQSGTPTVDGPCVNVSLQFFGAFVVKNPSCCGVGEFGGSTDFALLATY